eukprot:m.343589 g.343589  ORF g.343589 m.343589 type:complete len:71 (+) comp23064_c0_seq1:47-259(+)
MIKVVQSIAYVVVKGSSSFVAFSCRANRGEDTLLVRDSGYADRSSHSYGGTLSVSLSYKVPMLLADISPE